MWLFKQTRIEGGGNAKYNGRIAGGSTVPISLFPYQLSLRENVNHICGASIIASNWALSAAHCISRLARVNAISFRGGSARRIAGGIIFQAAQIVNLPRYTSGNLIDDVCVTNVASGTISVVSGWGITTTGGSHPVDPRAVNVPVVAQTTSSSQMGSGRITDAMVCAGQSGRDACIGDSGGPLDTGGAQFGIVSWGAPQCDCSDDLPGIFASTPKPTIWNFT